MDRKTVANLSKDIKDLSYSELGDLTARKGLPSYRTDQLFSYLYKKRISEFSEITVFSKELRTELAGEFSIRSLSVEAHQISKIDNSEKFLFRREKPGIKLIISGNDEFLFISHL